MRATETIPSYVSENTVLQHRSAIRRFLPLLGDRPVDEIEPHDVATMVTALHQAGKARATIQKSRTVLAMILDHAGVAPNPARHRSVRLPREEPRDIEPPSADHIKAAAQVLPHKYRLALVVLDATGARIGELVGSRTGDLDENRRAWLLRAALSKTRRPRWIHMPENVFSAVIESLPPDT